MAVRVGLIEGAINVNEVLESLARESAGEGCGAAVVFMGFVKGVVGGRRVKALRYEAHEAYALSKLREIGEDAVRRFGVRDVIILHRVGEALPGEPTVYVVVTAEGRREAFEAAIHVLERVKHEAPIYKLEVREDGEYWVIGERRRMRRASSAGWRGAEGKA